MLHTEVHQHDCRPQVRVEMKCVCADLGLVFFQEFEVDEVDAPIAKPQVITRNQSSAMMRVPSMPNNAITSTQTGGYARTLPHTPTDSVVDEAVDDLGDTMVRGGC